VESGVFVEGADGYQVEVVYGIKKVKPIAVKRQPEPRVGLR